MLFSAAFCKNIFRSMINGFAHCRCVYDEQGKLVDWEYLLVNPAFERLTGIKDAQGKKVSELIPDLFVLDHAIFETYEQISKTQEPQRFERYVKSLKIWFHVSAYSIEPGTFTAIFDNITDYKRTQIKLINTYDQTIAAWGKALELRDVYTRWHTLRTSDMVLRLAREFGVTGMELQNIRRGALLHDVGKMGIPDAILFKRDELTLDERRIIEHHPVLACEMLQQIPFLRDAMDIPCFHHEKWNGTGYPKGLMGDQIPFAARLFAVVDVYDALTNDRPYRASWPKARVIEHLLDERGKSFDPQVVDKFIEMVGRA